MTYVRPTSSLAGPFIMLLSAAIFGYFGFRSVWSTTGVNGEFLLFVALLEWTLKGSAIAFALAGLLTFIAPFTGNLLYTVTSGIGAILFVVIAIMDMADTQHTAISPILLLLFAAWNGYGTWTALHDLLAFRWRGDPRAPVERE